jgi:WD40 repeat protein
LKHAGGITAVAFSPDGQRFLAASRASTCQVRDVATLSLIAPPLEHAQPILAAVFSPDGRMVLTGSEDGTARLWESTSGRPLGPPLSHPHPVGRVGFSPDGQTMVTLYEATSTDHMVARFWKVPRPLQGEPPDLVLWAQVLTGMELEADGMIRYLDAEAWHQRKQQLAQSGGPPG